MRPSSSRMRSGRCPTVMAISCTPWAWSAAIWRASSVLPSKSSSTLGAELPRRRPTPAARMMAETGDSAAVERGMMRVSLLAGRLRVGGRRRDEALLRHDLADGGDQALEILRLDRADAADAEARLAGELTRIDDEAACC